MSTAFSVTTHNDYVRLHREHHPHTHYDYFVRIDDVQNVTLNAI